MGPDRKPVPLAAARNTKPASLSISAVLPAYNEEALIASTVRRVAAILRGLCADFEVVVTADGSRARRLYPSPSATGTPRAA